MPGSEERLLLRLSHLPPTFTTRAASDSRLSPRDLATLLGTGEIDELSRGVYRRADTEPTAHLDLLAVLAGPSFQYESSMVLSACLGGGTSQVIADPVRDPGLLERLASVSDPRGRRGRRYRLATLLALGACGMSVAGHDSVTAIAEWGRRADDEVPARLAAPFDPIAGRYQCQDDRTLVYTYARVDASQLAKAGFARLRPARLVQGTASVSTAPDGLPGREQRRAVCREADTPHRPRRRTAFAVDGKCLRAAKRPDGSQPYGISAVRHLDAVTAARQIPAKSNEIPSFTQKPEPLPRVTAAYAG